ncbi:MAG: HAD family phosphatase [Bdellovibrionales bacterium]
MQRAIDTLIFDLGNVLIRWQARPVVEDICRKTGVDFGDFWDNRLEAWNRRWDSGSMAEGAATTAKEFPAYAAVCHSFCERWIEMLGEPIEGSVKILEDMKASGYRLYAGSNWASDTFELARPRMPFLSLFDGLHISGHIGCAKPSPKFFTTLLDKFSVKPEQAVFIDDKSENISAAQSVGLHGIQFQNPAQLSDSLRVLGVRI